MCLQEDALDPEAWSAGDSSMPAHCAHHGSDQPAATAHLAERGDGHGVPALQRLNDKGQDVAHVAAQRGPGHASELAHGGQHALDDPRLATCMVQLQLSIAIVAEELWPHGCLPTAKSML